MNVNSFKVWCLLIIIPLIRIIASIGDVTLIDFQDFSTYTGSYRIGDNQINLNMMHIIKLTCKKHGSFSLSLSTPFSLSLSLSLSFSLSLSLYTHTRTIKAKKCYHFVSCIWNISNYATFFTVQPFAPSGLYFPIAIYPYWIRWLPWKGLMNSLRHKMLDLALLAGAGGWG